jgi:hypothetical protein
MIGKGIPLKRIQSYRSGMQDCIVFNLTTAAVSASDNQRGDK